MALPAIIKNKENLRNALTMMDKQMAMVLPSHVSANQIQRVVMSEVQKNPKILNCTTVSVLQCVMEACQLGIIPSSVQQLASLVPYGSKCQLIPGYKGLMKLVRQAGIGLRPPEAVYENDHFVYMFGINPVLEHKPAQGERGTLTHVYCIADDPKMNAPIFKVMSVEDCKQVMKGTNSKGNSGPWKDHFEAMCLKTVIRRLCKYLDTDSEKLTLAIQKDESPDFNIIDVDFTEVEIDGEGTNDLVKELEGNGKKN